MVDNRNLGRRGIEPITGAVTEAHRSSVEDFYKVIFDDLDVAVNQLAPGKSTDGRITQDVAKAFKARACLTRACATGEASLYAEAAMLAIVNAILSILIIVICGILPIVMEVQTKKQFFL